MEEKMKRYIFGVFIVLLFITTGCSIRGSALSFDEIVNLVEDAIDLPEQTSDNFLDFKTEYNIEGKEVSVTWITSDNSIISTRGDITRGFIDQEINIQIIIEHNNDSVTKDLGNVMVLGLTDLEMLDLINTVVEVPTTASEDINFLEQIELLGATVSLSWISSNQAAISNNGKVSFKDYEQLSQITVVAQTPEKTFNCNWGEITVPARNPNEHIADIISQVEIPTSTYSDIDLPTNIEGVYIQWSSSNKSVFTDNGRWSFTLSDTNIDLTAIYVYDGLIVEKIYNITVLTIPVDERMQIVSETVLLPEYVSTNVSLPTTFEYGVTGTWASSNPDIISPTGIVTLTSQENLITLTLTFHSGGETMEKKFTVTTTKLDTEGVFVNNHMLVDRVSDFTTTSLNNLMVNNDKIILNDTSLEGDYQSPIYSTNLFTSLVGSWAAITNINATAELEIRVRVNGTWSSYLSYSNWGLGLENAMENQNGGVARMSADEVLINNSQKADGFQYKITLRRDSLTNESPKLSLVGITINIPDYVYNVDVSNLPNYVDYDVPKLNQNIVPVIGNSICSVTSSTMLLMFKDHTFESEMPHEENSPLFKDYGNNIYGNWVFNTVGMSAFGEDSYVKRIYSWEELQHHLATVGPVALSIKGNTGRYTTNGHLIVVRGYEITENGTNLIVNDPNLSEVLYKYSLDTFYGFTRNVIYVIE